MNISPGVLKTIVDITGEPRIDMAIHDILKDAVELRMEKLEKKIKEYEEKYSMAFDEFDKKFQSEEISRQFSFPVETDYLDWEGLISRRKKLEKIIPGIL